MNEIDIALSRVLFYRRAISMLLRTLPGALLWAAAEGPPAPPPIGRAQTIVVDQGGKSPCVPHCQWHFLPLSPWPHRRQPAACRRPGRPVMKLTTVPC